MPISGNAIKDKINSLTETPSEAGFSVYVVVKQKDQSRQLKQMNFWEGNDGNLRTAIKAKIIDSLKKKFVESEPEFEPADRIADNQKKFYIIPTDDKYNPFPFLDSDSDTFSKDDVKNAAGFLFYLHRGEAGIWIYQHLWSILVPNKTNKNILARVFSSEEGDVFEGLKDPIITITEKIDLLIIDGHIITDNYKLLQQSFGFEDYIIRRATETVAAIAQKNIVKNIGMLREYISENPDIKYAKKLMRVADSKVLQMQPEQLLERIGSSKRWKGKIPQKDGKLILNEPEHVKYLIDLLDERYTKSEITDTEYDTEVKRVARS